MGRRDIQGAILAFVFGLFSFVGWAQISPLQLENPALTSENINWNYNMGYRFTANVDGQITHLGGRWTDGVSHTVRLYSYPSGTLVASTSVSGSINWAYGALGIPVVVSAGSEYVVAVRLDQQSSGCYSNGSNISFPIVQGGVTISATTYINGSNNMPTNAVTSAMYGQADITFVPCVYAGFASAGTENVIEGDSTTLTVVNNVGSVQWQVSTNGSSYTDIPGATGAQVNTGAITAQRFYRLRTTSGGCGADTSNVVVINKIDPFYPLRIQNPAITGQNLNWNYNMGYRFEATQDGQVTELGGRWRDGISHTVRLFAYPAGTLLASATVSGSMDWAYSSITPVNLTSGQQYVVAVRLDGQSSGTYANLSTPQTSAGIEILNGTYVSASNAMPTNSISSYIYGQADLRFEPCAYAGLLSPGNSVITKWDSTTITLVDNIGTPQWQQSTDGVTFTNISGATGSTINTGSLGQTMYYRTYIAGGGCSSDTSAVVSVSVLDPDYTLQALNPSITAQNLNWNYNMGYRFTANANGNVTELGGRWRSGVTHTVRLYAYPAGTLLASANVTSSGGWTYSSISSVSLTSGQQYVVAVRLDGQTSGIYGSVSMPATSGQITVDGSTYISASNNMPTNLNTTTMYGQADLKFEPCVFGGEASADDTLICPSGSTRLEVLNADGNIQWQESTNGTNFTNIAGANDTVYQTPALTQRTYYRVQTSAACGSDLSNVVTVRLIGGGLHGEWTGNLNTDWFEACNWADGQVPSAEDSVIIPFGTTPPSNMPAISLKYFELNIIGDFTLAGELTLTEGLALNSGRLRLGNFNLILSVNTTISGGQSTAYIQASGNGEIRKLYTSAGSSMTIPVGDNSQYTPIQFTLNSAILGAEAYFSFRSIDQNHPSLGTPTNRITRYWVIGGSNVSNINYNVNLTYADIDIVGTESLIVTRFLNPANQWSSYASASTSTNILTATGVTELGDFTGGDDLPFQSSQDGSWNSAATWSGGVVPGAGDDVTILPGHRVTLLAAQTVRSVSINSGGSIDLNGSTLNVEGDWAGYGTIDGGGTVTMSGSSSQQISGTTEFDILQINNSSGVSIVSGNTNIRTRVEITSGNLNAAGRLTLISDAAGSASIGEITGSLSGFITSQRHIGSVNSVDYRHICTPIAGSTFNDMIYHATNNPNGMYFYGFPGSNDPSQSLSSCYYFNEAAAGSSGDFNNGWQAPSSISSSNNYQNVVSYYSGGPNFSTYDFSITGTPNTGTITLTNLSLTGGLGWHLVGNPYPSSIDWNQVSKVGVDAVGYVFTNGGYVATNLLSPANEIAQYQGFFVRVNNASNSITFQENDKINNDATFRKTTPVKDRVRFSLTNTNQGITTYSAVDWKEDASTAFDSQYDAYIIGNPGSIPDLGFEMNGEELQVNALPRDQFKGELTLITRCKEAGTFELKVDLLPEEPICLVLIDHLENKKIPLEKGSVVSFAMKPGDDIHRFSLSYVLPYGDLKVNNVSCYGAEDGSLELSTLHTPTWNMTAFDSYGKSLSVHPAANPTTLSVNGLGPGIYLLQISDSAQLCPVMNSRVTILEPAQMITEFDPSANWIDLNLSGEVSFYNQSVEADRYEWDFGDGQKSTLEHPVHLYNIEGVYTVRLTSFQENCSSSVEKSVTVSRSALSTQEWVTNGASFFESDGHLIIRIPQATLDASLEVLDLTGKVVWSQKWNRLEAGEHRIVHDGWSESVYLYRLHGSNLDLGGKIILGK